MGCESKAIIVWNKLKMGESLAVALLSPIYLKFFSLLLALQHHDVAIGRGGDDVLLVGGGDGVHE